MLTDERLDRWAEVNAWPADDDEHAGYLARIIYEHGEET